MSEVGAVRVEAARDLADGAPQRVTGVIWRDGWPLVVVLAASLLLLSLLPTGRLILAALTRAGEFMPDAALAEITSRAALRALAN